MSNDRIRTLIQAELPALTAIRHDLHRHPELFYQERRTSGVVQRELAALGIEMKTGLGTTGVVAHLPATDAKNRDRPSVALRADMDALPITEQTGKPYASATAGVMHACGHDGHTTMLLGAARVLSKLDRRPNPVTFVFQPAEEGGAGAERLCDEGALLGAKGGGVGPPVGRIFGLHGWPQIDLGIVATRPGPLMASTDEVVITIRGTQAHGAYPHLGNDPIVCAAHVVTALQTIASRNTSPQDAVVVTVGVIQGGTASNIIPQTVRLEATVRALRTEVRAATKQRLFQVVEGVASGLGCKAEINWEEGYPTTVNDGPLTERFFAAARDALGPERVATLDQATMGAEDFSYYGRHVPACFFFLGLRPGGAPAYPTLHQPDFDFNDDAMPTGIEMFCRLATAE